MFRRRPREQVVIPGLDIAKAKRYSRIKLGLFLASTAFGLARSIWLSDQRRSVRLRQAVAGLVPDERLAGPAYLAAVTGLGWAASLPLAYVRDHVVEKRFGLTKQSTSGWLGDAAKGLVLELAIGVPITAGAFAIIRRRPRDWWLVLSGIAVPMTVIASNLAPVLIMPLFNRFEPIADRETAERIRDLTRRAGVTIADVYQMDMSRQTEKPNAFFTGLGQTKRIVLGDTLLDRFAPAEIDGVVAHELGHQVHGDIWRLIAVGSVAGFGTAYAVSRIAPALLEKTAERTGVTDLGDEASLPLLSIVMSGLSLLMAPAMAAFSRAMEQRTDRFALDLTGDGAAYAAAMERLAAQSLTDPDPPAPVVFFLYSHPPMAERVATARRYEAERTGN